MIITNKEEYIYAIEEGEIIASLEKAVLPYLTRANNRKRLKELEIAVKNWEEENETK